MQHELFNSQVFIPDFIGEDSDNFDICKEKSLNFIVNRKAMRLLENSRVFNGLKFNCRKILQHSLDKYEVFITGRDSQKVMVSFRFNLQKKHSLLQEWILKFICVSAKPDFSIILNYLYQFLVNTSVHSNHHYSRLFILLTRLLVRFEIESRGASGATSIDEFEKKFFSHFVSARSLTDVYVTIPRSKMEISSALSELQTLGNTKMHSGLKTFRHFNKLPKEIKLMIIRNVASIENASKNKCDDVLNSIFKISRAYRTLFPKSSSSSSISLLPLRTVNRSFLCLIDHFISKHLPIEKSILTLSSVLKENELVRSFF